MCLAEMQTTFRRETYVYDYQALHCLRVYDPSASDATRTVVLISTKLALQQQFSGLLVCNSTCSYWTIQAGLLTPLIFARNLLSHLSVFTFGAYFFHSGRR